MNCTTATVFGRIIGRESWREPARLGDMKPFRFGINVRDASARAEWQDKARKVEGLGYSVLLVPDHLAAMLATIPAVMSAADVTKSLRVGTNVLNNDLRHPVVLAREAATVDVLTDGRLELGLGAGHMRSEYEEAGIDFDDDAIRVQRLGEAVLIVKGLLSGERVSFEGHHYRASGHLGHPPPVQRPHPPLLVGGHGKGTLTLAATQA